MRPALTVAAGGVALALAFPRPDLHLLAWLALVPLLVAARDATPMAAWWYGLAFGFVFRAVTLFWLIGTMTRYGGLPTPIAVAAAALLMLYLATYHGLFALAVQRVGFGDAGRTLLLAMGWVGLEYVQSTALTGFPWGLLGYPGGATTVLAQTADLAGVYGLGVLVVLTNLGIAAQARAGTWRTPQPPALVALVALTAALGYGGLRLAAAQPAPGALSIGLIQGNVAQDQKWDAGLRETVLRRHLDLSRQVAERGVDLIVWPESSWPDPNGLERDPVSAQRLAAIAQDHDTAMLVGTVHVQEQDRRLTVSNSALLLDPTGAAVGRYDKVHLVPFGEYLPFRNVLGALGPIVQAVGELRPGPDRQPLLEAPGLVPPVGLAICYEIAFPGLVRSRVQDGAEFLVTITNDAWFGRSSGPYQHFAMARLRAVETRRWLLRAANTGISGVVDPWGRIVAASEVEVEAALHARIRPRTGSTLYVRSGDLFARICSLVALLLVVGSLFPARLGWLLDAAPAARR